LVVEKLPLLGSGKIDAVALSQLVRERTKLDGVAWREQRGIPPACRGWRRCKPRGLPGHVRRIHI